MSNDYVYLKNPLLPLYIALFGESTSYQLESVVSCLVLFLKVQNEWHGSALQLMLHEQQRCSMIPTINSDGKSFLIEASSSL